MSELKLYVGNIAPSLTQPELEGLFAAHGTVIDVKVPVDRETGRPRGFAFVRMASPEAANAAIQALNGYSLANKPLTVSEARSQGDRPAFNPSEPDRRRFGGLRQ